MATNRVRIKTPSRRDIVRLAAATAVAAPFVAAPGRAQSSQPTLKIAKWAHFIPEYDAWFSDEVAQEWGRQHDTRVVVDHIPIERVREVAFAEVEAGSGHDVFMFPWPPAEFQRHVIDHAEIYQRVAVRWGQIDRFAHYSSYDPRDRSYFAVVDWWVPQALQYFRDAWDEVGMTAGPLTYGSLTLGGKNIRDRLGVPCGLAMAPNLAGNVTLNTLLYGFRGRVLDAAGNVAIGRGRHTISAMNYAKTLHAVAGTPDQLAWGPSGHVEAMLARRSSATIAPISLVRTAERDNPDIAGNILISQPLLGTNGVFGLPYATNCSVVWKFAQNQEGAKQFIGDFLDNLKTGYEKSRGCNLPTFQKTLPNFIARLDTDPATPARKYNALKDALHWTRNMGFPSYANPAGMEIFNSFVVQRMFASVITGQSSPEDAVSVAEAEMTRIVERWKDA